MTMANDQRSGESFGPIEILRAGTFTGMNNQPQTITAQELERIAATYDAADHPAPIVIGHPEADAPAYGWVDSLFVEGGTLKATIRDAVPEFTEAIRKGRYQKVSVSLFLPNTPANPKPASFYLKHIGFLGAAAPAVPGLKPVRLGSGAEGTISLTQGHSEASAEESELQRLRREVRRRQIDDLISEGRVLPVFQDEILDFVACLDSTDTVSFSDGSTATRQDWFLSYLARQPAVVTFGAMDIGRPPPEGGSARNMAPEGYTVDPNRSPLYDLARQLEQEKGISFAAAVDLAVSMMR